MIATLEFIHFEDAYESDARGIVVEPPASWQPSEALLTTLLTEMAGNPVLSPVTLSQFFAQVPQGGNEEPAARHLQAGAPSKSGVIAAGTARHLATARAHLTSFSEAVDGHQHPRCSSSCRTFLLATENQSFDPAQRAAALAVFIQRFGSRGQPDLPGRPEAPSPSRRAPHPSRCRCSPRRRFPSRSSCRLSSDKFAFPDGSARTLTLDHPTTPVRIEARSVTSGDRLPVEVTLTTPDGQLVIARAALTVRSTSISIVGIALTVLAAIVLLVWWARTWRKGRNETAARRMSMETPPIELPPPVAGRGRLSLTTAASYVALGTGVSRVTGLLRIVALAWALGQTHVADAFNLANTTPNMLYDIVLGGVLSATFIPVFVDQLSNRTKEEAFTSISAVLSVSMVVLVVSTVGAPWCWRPSSSPA